MGCTVYARVAVVASSIHAHTSSHGPVRGGAASASGCTFISLLVVFRAPTCSRKSTPNAATVLAHDYAIIRCDLRRRKGTGGSIRPSYARSLYIYYSLARHKARWCMVARSGGRTGVPRRNTAVVAITREARWEASRGRV